MASRTPGRGPGSPDPGTFHHTSQRSRVAAVRPGRIQTWMPASAALRDDGSVTPAEIALIAATGTHLGFQVTVTALVYPALARTSPDRWADAHRAHSRAIAPLVAVVYGTLLLVSAWVLWSRPGLAAVAAVAATAVAMAVTAFAAAPMHSRLGQGHDRDRIRRLVRVDRARAVAATAALIAALMSGW